MIDLHNHILPGIDDGARDMAEALAMAKAAVASGTTALAATPHRFWHNREQKAPQVLERVATLQAELDAREIRLKIIPATEIPMGPDVAVGLRDNTLLRFGGDEGTHALIETPFDRLPSNAITLLEDLVASGIIPVLAHPERSTEIQHDLAFIETASAVGAMLQLTTGSILGHFGDRPRRTARAIAERTDWRIIIASDAHWAHDRTVTHMREAAQVVAAWIGDPSRAAWMIVDGPASCVPARFRQV
ncbi:MAG TPA: CpsB/CapC family capsule biosynthesis tyrosine phosphatase [Capsulimonadaceae bacterium]|jgi:protein-tyrosine phosphatase